MPLACKTSTVLFILQIEFIAKTKAISVVEEDWRRHCDTIRLDRPSARPMVLLLDRRSVLQWCAEAGLRCSVSLRCQWWTALRRIVGPLPLHRVALGRQKTYKSDRTVPTHRQQWSPHWIDRCWCADRIGYPVWLWNIGTAGYVGAWRMRNPVARTECCAYTSGPIHHFGWLHCPRLLLDP